MSTEAPQPFLSGLSGYVGEMCEMKGRAAALKLIAMYAGFGTFVYAPRLYGGPHSSEDFKEFWETAFGENPLSHLLGMISEHVNETPLYGETVSVDVPQIGGIEIPNIGGLAFEASLLAALGVAVYGLGIGLVKLEKLTDTRKNYE
jgi:hypothetical protein